jgi:hypothetical protein
VSRAAVLQRLTDLTAPPPGEPVVVNALDAFKGNKKATRLRILDLVCQTNALGT